MRVLENAVPLLYDMGLGRKKGAGKKEDMASVLLGDLTSFGGRPVFTVF